MFARNLTKDEVSRIHQIAAFIKRRHGAQGPHDYPHILEVTRNAIEIAERVKDQVDPFVLICGALLHDIGRIDDPKSTSHGLAGTSTMASFLDRIGVNMGALGQITKIVSRHTPTAKMRPATVEEKIVFDAERLEALGRIGIVRSIMNRNDSIEDILGWITRKGLDGYHITHFSESRDLGAQRFKATEIFVNSLKTELKRRCKDINDLKLPKSEV